MAVKTSNAPSSASPDLSGAVIRRIGQVMMALVIQASIQFVSAGDLRWVWGWVNVGACLGVVLFNFAMFARTPHAKELIAERGSGEFTKAWDRIVGLAGGLLGPLAILVVAGLDYRYGWTGALSLAVHLAALALMVAGYLLVTWSMVANAYFSTVVRIQDERGHQVAQGGPYRVVRHPGYAGMITYNVMTALVLGSLWALIPAGITAVLFVVRTALEDRALRAELPGYEDYTRQTRYRLLPGVW